MLESNSYSNNNLRLLFLALDMKSTTLLGQIQSVEVILLHLHTNHAHANNQERPEDGEDKEDDVKDNRGLSRWCRACAVHLGRACDVVVLVKNGVLAFCWYAGGAQSGRKEGWRLQSTSFLSSVYSCSRWLGRQTTALDVRGSLHEP